MDSNACFHFFTGCNGQTNYITCSCCSEVQPFKQLTKVTLAVLIKLRDLTIIFQFIILVVFVDVTVTLDSVLCYKISKDKINRKGPILY